MLTKVVYGGAFPMVAGCVTPNRVWRHTGVKSLKNHHVRGNQKFNVLADSKDSPLEARMTWTLKKKGSKSKSWWNLD